MEENLFRSIPRVDELLGRDELKVSALPPVLLRESVREELDALRDEVRGGLSALPETGILCARILARAEEKQLPTLRSVINATGVTLHTNLGRACLSERAANAAAEAARDYSTLEYDVENGCRGSRYQHVEALLCRLTGAEAAMAVNNNAAAVLLILSALAGGGEVIASRGELVEIGGSFRIPEIVTQCGCTLCEVGATNKTHRRDYEAAIGEQTRALLKVHTSNYRIVGFTESVPREELAEIAHGHGLPLIEDLGSGAIVDLEPFGIRGEPTVQRSLHAGVDVASFSGDKLLGGPQAGIVVGSKQLIDRLKKNPLARAMRLDKMTLAALEATLRLYLDPERALAAIPTLRMLSEPDGAVRERAERLADALRRAVPADCACIEVVPEVARAGGGALPLCDIPTFAASISFERGDAQGCEAFLVSKRAVPVIGRIKREAVLLDARTIGEDDIAEIAEAVRAYFEGPGAAAASAGIAEGAAEGSPAPAAPAAGRSAGAGA